MENLLGERGGLEARARTCELFYGILSDLELILPTQDFKGAYARICNGEDREGISLERY